MLELRYILRDLRLAKQRLDQRSRLDLLAMGVPERNIDELFKAHAACRKQLSRAELQMRRSLTPKLTEWLKSGWELNRRDEFFFWRGHASRMHVLELELGVRNPRGLQLEAKIDAWWAKHKK